MKIIKVLANIKPHELTEAFDYIFPRKLNSNKICFICIGTDKSTGDSFAPRVGTLLEEYGYDVIGTMNNPCHATNLEEKIELISKTKKVISIGAAVTDKKKKIGKYSMKQGKHSAGLGVNKILKTVGDFSISSNVCIDGDFVYFNLANVKINFVEYLAETLVEEIERRFPIEH